MIIVFRIQLIKMFYQLINIIMMHQNCQQSEFAPWFSRQEPLNPFELQHHQDGSRASQLQTLELQQIKQEANSNKNILVKKVDKYAQVLPKVYQKIQEEVNRNHKKNQLKRLEVMLKAINKNQLIIRVPQNRLHLPKVHPIKHSIKKLKRIHQVQDNEINPQSSQILKKGKVINGRWSQLQERGRSDSHESTNSKSYVNVLKRLNNFEQQMVKKCSLKNLKIFKEHDNSYEKMQRLLANKQGNMPHKVYQKKERKHILDRILTRLQ